MKKKIAIVNQRYGMEVNGGSEYYTRLIAERLNAIYEVEILTTTAMDYVTWASVYAEGEQTVDNVRVRRFAVEKERNIDEFSEINGKTLSMPVRTREAEQKWIDAQGPYCPALVQYIVDHAQEYDTIIFVTYLYYLTVMALPQVAEKAILIPTAHDEPYLYFNSYQKVFCTPRAIIFLTEEEKKLVHGYFHNEDIPHEVMGVGIDVPEKIDAAAFRKKFGIADDFLIYVGRIDESKGCAWLFYAFKAYQAKHKGNLKLVLMGKAVLEIPNNPDIISLGFVTEEDKFNGIAASKALLLPSHFESLSISVLEAMALGIPVLVSGLCEVLKGHCRKSNAGLYYSDAAEFEQTVDYLLTHPDEYRQMQQNAKKYVAENYQWPFILQKFQKMIEKN